MKEYLKGNTFRFLRSRGFSPVYSSPKERSFRGVLLCKKGKVEIKLTISDWNFLRYPKITITEYPSFLPKVIPHIGVDGDICYFSPGSVVLDRYDPKTAMAQCLDKATYLLDRACSDEHYRTFDIQEEFEAHWLNNHNGIVHRTLIGKVNFKTGCADYALINIDGEERAFITGDPQELEVISKLFDDDPPVRTSCKCWLFETNIPPNVPSAMPVTIKEVFSWLQQWDRKIYNGIQRVLDKEKSYLQYKFITFAIKSPVGWIGFGFDLGFYRLGAKNKPSLYKQHLHGKGGFKEIKKLAVIDVSADFIHSRNLTFPDLRGKRLTLIGCGSIGSFLAQSLVRLGAGTGGGTLTLIDPDNLAPENLGRHLLGFPSLFQAKAHVLASELKKLFPLSRIEAICTNAFEYQKLFTTDLIIDATGEEAASEYLNGLRLERVSEVPVLHVWIKGNGECVQALWTDRKEGGCFRCLKQSGSHNYREERYPVLKHEPERRFVGCHSYTPYAVSAPMQAATLATDMVIDWLNGNPSPKFRTRSVENADVKKVNNQDISKLQGCPACSQVHYGRTHGSLPAKF